MVGEVCVSPMFDVAAGGGLGLVATAGVQIAGQHQWEGDDDWSSDPLTVLPGMELWDDAFELTNTADHDRYVMLRIQRPYYIAMRVPQPNALQVRDGWECRVGEDPPEPTVDVTRHYRGIWTASLDLGTTSASGGTPHAGKIEQYSPSFRVDEIVHVPAGETIIFRWAAWVWTPPPWSDNANDGHPLWDIEWGDRMVTAMWIPDGDK